MGEQQVKNIARPVRIYRISLAEAVRTKAPLPLPDKPSLTILPFQNMTDDSHGGLLGSTTQTHVHLALAVGSRRAFATEIGAYAPRSIKIHPRKFQRRRLLSWTAGVVHAGLGGTVVALREAFRLAMNSQSADAILVPGEPDFQRQVKFRRQVGLRRLFRHHPRHPFGEGVARAVQHPPQA